MFKLNVYNKYLVRKKYTYIHMYSIKLWFLTYVFSKHIKIEKTEASVL